LTPPINTSTETTKLKQDFLDTLALSLVGKRYESLDGAEDRIPADEQDSHREMHLEVVDWLRRAM
jgi:lipoate-protein ligase A